MFNREQRNCNKFKGLNNIKEKMGVLNKKQKIGEDSMDQL